MRGRLKDLRDSVWQRVDAYDAVVKLSAIVCLF